MVIEISSFVNILFCYYFLKKNPNLRVMLWLISHTMILHAGRILTLTAYKWFDSISKGYIYEYVPLTYRAGDATVVSEQCWA